MTTGKRVAVTVVLCLAFSALVLLGFINKLSKPRILSDAELREYGTMILDTPRRFSDFKLVDHNGAPFTRDDLMGKRTLIFFGFSHCPDICPSALATLNKVVEPLEEEEKANLQVIMLSVDPERDTPEKLAQYVPYFNPDFRGVTGDPYQILSLATQLGVAYQKVPQGDDYTVDHTGNIVIINPRGDYHGLFRPPFEGGSMRVAWRSIAYTFEH